MNDPVYTFIAEGHRLSTEGDFQAAEICFRKALDLNPSSAMALNNLGWACERAGKVDEAVGHYERALDLNAELALAQVNLATLLARLGRHDQAVPIWDELLESGIYDEELINDAIDSALAQGDIRYAAQWAEVCAQALRGSSVSSGIDTDRIVISGTADAYVTAETLEHDIEQIRYLIRCGGMGLDGGRDLEGMARHYEAVLTAWLRTGTSQRRPLTDEEQALIGETYGRIFHSRITPRIDSSSIWGRWNPGSVERAYANSRSGICVIDDFLSPDALHELRLFCLESTVWFRNHYAHGRLGAFFREGFNCPLLVQIAEELRVAFPRLIGDTHRLLQLWGFKYGAHQPATHAHADFAAVNVNFWLTPEGANLDENSGGLVVYDREAPEDWNFDAYNKEGQKISNFLRQSGARGVSIPYRSNRAVIFNSDLFHATAPLTFRRGFENRRINVTMLYGRRSEDSKGSRLPAAGL